MFLTRMPGADALPHSPSGFFMRQLESSSHLRTVSFDRYFVFTRVRQLITWSTSWSSCNTSDGFTFPCTCFKALSTDSVSFLSTNQRDLKSEDSFAGINGLPTTKRK